MDKSHVIVSTNEVLSVCSAVALEIAVEGVESTGWAGPFDWCEELLLTMNSK